MWLALSLAGQPNYPAHLFRCVLPLYNRPLPFADTGEPARLAQLVQSEGLDGVVCSPAEISATRDACGPDFKLIVPGIRPDWAATGDQKRITTPAQARDDGADVLVIGRPITGADDPAAAAARIAGELGLAG